ncbi:MAG: hypothetical protein IJ223_05885 [Clostridia bacterium]|nr:hypothetical protein [Clostridia bacterium]
MFIYNFKLSRTNIFKILLVLAIIIFIILFGIAMYKIVSASLNQNFKVEDNIFKNGIASLTSDNYTDVLKMVHNDIDTYIGQKINFSGYVYKAPDFKNTEFVLARNMLVNNNTQTLIVGFLCDCKDISKYEEGTWVEITGEITKGNYHGDIPIIKITQINKIQKPENEYVYPPDDTYIPTSVIL